ncbi:MAG: OmpA family protein [Bacteroidota bacterium]
MKSQILRVVLGMALTITSWTVVAQNYYVIVGAFTAETQASEFTTQLPHDYMDTAYFSERNQNLLHLYVLKTSSKELAISRTLQLQRQIESATPDNTGLIGNYESISLTNNLELGNVASRRKIELAGSNASDVAGSRGESPSGSSAAFATTNAPMKPKGKIFKFTISTTIGNALHGSVHHVDFERERDVATFTADAYMDILNPGRNGDPMAVVCGVFGYKQVEKYIDYADPAATEGVYQDEHGAWVIPYTLERLEKGDVSIMYNVTFHKDAVIMLPQSKKELDDLVTMMNENPYYEIKIHGHCNGKNKRKIIALGPTKNYFDVHGSLEINGSAKTLSCLRANAVRAYLIDQGIDERRLKTFAWGGTYSLVDRHNPHARLNDRVEIEIMKD